MMLTRAMMMVALCAMYRDRGLDMGQETKDGEDGISNHDYLRKFIWRNGFSFGLRTIGKENMRRCLKQEMKMIQKKERVIKKKMMMDGIERSQPSLYRIM
jgi:hypothetical protein